MNLDKKVLFEEKVNQYLNNEKVKKEKEIFQTYINSGEIEAPKTQKMKKNQLSDQELFINSIKNLNHHASFLKNQKESSSLSKRSSNQKNLIPEIDLHGQKVSDVIPLVRDFLLSQLPHIKIVRVIHGKGLHQGKISEIKVVIQKYLASLRKEKKIKDFSFESPENGGHGSTRIWLK